MTLSHGLAHAVAAPAAASAGLLAVWHGVAPGCEEAFDDWYDRQHHRERVDVPGFLRARRYVNADRGPRYFSRYDVVDASVLASAPYLARVNQPTDWTRSLMPHYRDTTRAVFRRAAACGEADGGYLVTLRFIDGTVADPERWLADVHALLPALVTDRGVLRAEVWHADREASTLHSEEKRLRPGADVVVAQALLIEGSDLARVQDAVAKRLGQVVVPGAVADGYRLVFDLRCTRA